MVLDPGPITVGPQVDGISILNNILPTLRWHSNEEGPLCRLWFIYLMVGSKMSGTNLTTM